MITNEDIGITILRLVRSASAITRDAVVVEISIDDKDETHENFVWSARVKESGGLTLVGGSSKALIGALKECQFEIASKIEARAATLETEAAKMRSALK